MIAKRVIAGLVPAMAMAAVLCSGLYE